MGAVSLNEMLPLVFYIT